RKRSEGVRGSFTRPACGERARVRGTSIKGPVEAGGDVEIFRVIRPQQPVPQREVEDDQIDVELEVIARADAVEDGRGRHQLEMNDFAVLVFRYEIGRYFEIENEQHVIADAELVFHAIGDGTGPNRMAGEALRE